MRCMSAVWPLRRRVARNRSRVSVMACCGVDCDVSSMIESSVVRVVEVLVVHVEDCS